jgi:hypothetical protein
MGGSSQISRWQQTLRAAAISQLIFDIESVRGRYITQCLQQAKAAPATAAEWEAAAAEAEATLDVIARRAEVLFNVCCRE